MKSWTNAVRLLRTALLGVALLGPGMAAAATPQSWKDTGFSIDANGMTLSNVLEEFGRVYGVRVNLGMQREVLLKGRLKADSGGDFLDRLAQPYRFRWFVYNGTLYVVPREDNASVRLTVGEDAVQDAKQALIGVGLFDPRFGWGELPDEGIVIVSGPREYVNLARSILLPQEGKVLVKGRQVMVFRLKYASATDRVITSRGRSETVPGVKTILSRLLFGPESAEKISEARARLDVGSHKPSRRPKTDKGEAREVGGLFGLASRRAADGVEPDEGERPLKYVTADERPRIEADPTLNAVIIYDAGNRRAMYEELIQELDIEPQQVEIEALIVDIDRKKLSEMGVEWGTQSRGGHVGSRINAAGADSRGIELPLPGSTLLISNAARFYARLKAMEGSGEARVLATPTVLTLDNVAAVLDLSQTRYMPLLAERYADLADVTAGTMLRVIPRIVRDASATRVRLEVDIEDGVLGDSNANASVTRSTISTQAIVDVQQTLVIGGYHAESLSRKRDKVPVLGDVPVMGNLFRHDAEDFKARERLFLITPRLVGSSGTPAEDKSRATRWRESTLTRAGGAPGGGRPAELRDEYGRLMPQSAAPAWQEPHRPQAQAQAVASAAPRLPVAAAEVLPMAGQPAATARPNPPVPIAQVQAATPAAARPPGASAAVMPAAAVQKPVAVLPAMHRPNIAAAPASAPMPEGRFGRDTYRAAFGVPAPAGVLPAAPAARPTERGSAVPRAPSPVPDPAYAALLIAEARRNQALQALQRGAGRTPAPAATGRQDAPSGAVDLSLADRRALADWN